MMCAFWGLINRMADVDERSSAAQKRKTEPFQGLDSPSALCLGFFLFVVELQSNEVSRGNLDDSQTIFKAPLG